MADKSTGGSFIPGADYTIAGAWTFTGAATMTSPVLVAPTLTTPTLTSPTITGTTVLGAGSTLTTPALVSPVVTGNAGTGLIYCKQCLFTENATSTTHTATFTIPAGSALVDIIVIPEVLWTGGTAAFTCGDANAATGWFTSTDLKATDLILGERLQASGGTHAWGGKQGAYLDNTSGRFGQQSTNMIGGYCPTAYSVIGVVTVGTPATTAGRTRMYVLWMVGESVAPVLA